jgi:hypothetical protein
MTDFEKVKHILETLGIGIGISSVPTPTSASGLTTVTMPIGTLFVRYLRDIPNDMNAIREVELLVIEKVGAGHYWESLMTVANRNVLVIATAKPEIRIAAMLAALEGKK